MKVIVVSPHLDDAALSCACRIRSGGIEQVVTVFAGLESDTTPLSDWDRITRATSARARCAERRAEDAAAWRSIDQPFTHLPFAESEAANIPAIRAALRSILTGAELLLAPAGIGGHPHHLLVRDLVLAEARSARVILYADLPYAAFYGWPQEEPASPDVEAYWRQALETNVRWVPAITRLEPEVLTWKQALLSHYRTQMPAIRGGSLSLFDRTDLLQYEVEFLPT